MATTNEYHDYVIECLNKAGEVTSRKMMGEYCLYYNGKLFGDICDNRLLVKQTETSKWLLADCPLEYPYEGSKTLMFLVSEFENPELIITRRNVQRTEINAYRGLKNLKQHPTLNFALFRPVN